MIEEAYGRRRCRLLGYWEREWRWNPGSTGKEWREILVPIISALPEIKFSPIILSYTTLRLIDVIFYQPVWTGLLGSYNVKNPNCSLWGCCRRRVQYNGRERCHRLILLVQVAQSPTLCDPMDNIVYIILQARILECIAVPFSRGSSQPRDQNQVSHIAGQSFTSWACILHDCR